MSSAIVKSVKRYGNSGGVYVPSTWIGGKVKIELVEEPINPRDILNKLPLEHVISVILYGSYARKEATTGSDVDIILIVDEERKISIPAEIKQKYDIQIKSPNEMKNALVHDPVFYKMIEDDSVALINHNFLDSLTMEAPKTLYIDKRVEMIESSMNITKKIFAMDDNADIIYPLVLRLKEILLIDYLLSGKRYSTKALKQEILECGITSSEFSALMNVYRAERTNRRIPKPVLLSGVLTKLISLVEKKIEYVRQKTHKKKGLNPLRNRLRFTEASFQKRRKKET